MQTANVLVEPLAESVRQDELIKADKLFKSSGSKSRPQTTTNSSKKKREENNAESDMSTVS